MSIINDALKKAAKQKDKNTKTIKQKLDHKLEVVFNKPPSAKTDKKRSLNNRNIIIGCVIVFIVLGLSVMFLHNTTKYYPVIQTQPLSSSRKPAQARMPRISQLPFSKSPSSSLTSGYSVSGIVHGEGTPMAVINGEVYAEGDTIDNAIISKISEDVVILQKGKRLISLKLR